MTFKVGDIVICTDKDSSDYYGIKFEIVKVPRYSGGSFQCYLLEPTTRYSKADCKRMRTEKDVFYLDLEEMQKVRTFNISKLNKDLFLLTDKTYTELDLVSGKRAAFKRAKELLKEWNGHVIIHDINPIAKANLYETFKVIK